MSIRNIWGEVAEFLEFAGLCISIPLLFLVAYAAMLILLEISKDDYSDYPFGTTGPNYSSEEVYIYTSKMQLYIYTLTIITSFSLLFCEKFFLAAVILSLTCLFSFYMMTFSFH